MEHERRRLLALSALALSAAIATACGPVDESDEDIDAEAESDADVDTDPDSDVDVDVDTDADAGADPEDDGEEGVEEDIVTALAATTQSQTPVTITTANIGRSYNARSRMAAALDHVGDVIGPMSGPRFIGWQEIGEGDPCGANCEIEELRGRFRTSAGWSTKRPAGTKPNGGTERVKVPVTFKGAGAVSTRTAYASAGWAGVSPTRFVTVVHDPAHNLSVLNTHLIAGAWSCKSHVAQRRAYWRDGWNVLKAQVAHEHALGRNVVVTGDLNRGRAANHCNPAWNPAASLHPRAKVVGGTGIDYIFAVPANGWSFTIAKRANGSLKRGTVALGIDTHKAHWVTGRFHH